MYKRRDNSIAYTDEKVEYVKKLLENKVTVHVTTASRMMCEHFGIEYNEEIGRTYRNKFKQDLELVNTVSYIRAKERRLPESRFYLLTSAQNSTPVHKGLLKNMEALVEHIGDCSLGVIASRYRNPSLYDEGLKENYWDDSLDEYLIASRMELFTDFVVGADVRIPYTTNRPVQNAKRMCKDYSFVVGHPKQDMEAMPMLDNTKDKFIMSTGSVTLPSNYSDTMAGESGRVNHKMGFLFIEVVDREKGIFKAMNIEAMEDGSFDLPNIRVTNNGQIHKYRPSLIDTIVLGDLHVGFHNEEELKDSLDFVMSHHPNNVVLHDVLSAESVHRYNINDAFKAYRMMMEGVTIEKEIEDAIDMIKDIAEMTHNVIIPSANHHYILENWVKNYSWKSSLINAEKYMEFSQKLLRGDVSEKGLFGDIVDGENIDGVKTLSYNKSHRIKGVEVGQHGDKGINGSRGNMNAYDKIGVPHIVGHGHGAKKYGDVIMVGTLSKLRMGYNQGYSTWRNNVIGVIYNNCKIGYIIK